MDTSPDLWTTLTNYWYSLREGTRDNIIGGLIVAVLLGFGTIFRKALAKGIKRAFGKTPPLVQPAQSATHVQPATQHEVVIKVETPQQTPPVQVPQPALPDAETPAPSPEIPRTAAVEFVPRRDKAGRDILAQLKEKLSPQNHQLIVLWGPGGVGKTRLANEAAQALQEAFDNRIVWASADGLPDFSLSTLLDGIATQLDRIELRQFALEPKKERVRELIASESPLIILDNFETIAPQEQKHCTSFLAQDASCPALITTRAMIASNFAHNIPIDAMSLDEAQKFLDELIAQCPDAEVFTEEDRRRIIQTSTANPLIMQWVVQQIILAQEPQAVLDKLSHGEGDAAERVFDNSFNLPHVGDDGRSALLALSLFTPSASRAALAEIAGFGGDVERLNQAAASLGALRLVRTAEGGKRLLIEGLTRELAKAHLAKAKNVAEFRQRFVTHFLSYAKAHAQLTPEDFDALEVEKDNVLGAMDLAFQVKDWSRVVEIASIIIIPGMLYIRGYWEEAIRRGEQAVIAAQSNENEWAVAQFAGNTATIRMRRGEYDEAGRTYQQALAAFRKLGSEENVAVGLHQLGRLAHDKGELVEARRLYDESFEIKKKLGLKGGIATTLHQLALLAQDQGELVEARRLYNESLEIKKRLNEPGGIASTLHQLGRLAQDQGEFVEARRLYNESLEIEIRLGSQSGIASTLHQLGRLAENENNKIEAARLFREALCILERLNSPDAEVARHSLERVETEAS